MQPKRINKYLRDVEDIIIELEQIQKKYDNDFLKFSNDFLATKATERCFEIIGEALKCILMLDPTIAISHTRRIIGLRNMIAHEYDKISPSFLWTILQDDIPLLKSEIQALKNEQ